MTDPGGDWWRTAFAEHYSEVYHHRDDSSAAAEIAGLLPRLQAAPGPVLDACCGGGRHLAAMRDAGLDVYGFDFSGPLLRLAQVRAEVAGRVARADMRRPPFAGGFGAITLLFTAFGYFEDRENAECLAAFGRLLAPGGWLVLDLPNRERMLAGLVATSTRTTPSGLLVREQRHLVGERVEKRVEVSRDGAPRATWSESVRLYRAAEIARFASRSELRLAETWPGLHGPSRDEARAVYWLRRRWNSGEGDDVVDLVLPERDVPEDIAIPTATDDPLIGPDVGGVPLVMPEA